MNIPSVITFALKDPATKAAWISEFPVLPGKCQNCGGVGIVAAFIATEGPYDTPAHKRGEVWLTSKTEIINGLTKYWVGQTISAPCPDCQNQLAPTSVTPTHTFDASRIKKLANDKSTRRDDDYTT
jgi:hypothetical protein